MEHEQKTKLAERIFLKDLDSSEIKNKINEIKRVEKQIKRNYLVYEWSTYTYDFKKIPAIRSFGDIIFSCKITTSKANKKKSNLLNFVLNFNNKVRLRSKTILIKAQMFFMKGEN